MTKGKEPPPDRLFVVSTPEELARAAAGRLWGTVRERAATLSRSGETAPGIRVALSGGETPRRTFEVLSAEPFRSRFPWDLVHFYQVDERWVPPGDARSNRRMLCESLLSRAPIPREQFHFIDTGLAGPDDAARRYEDEVRDGFPSTSGGLPRFDAILMGIGADGHTASLFPGAPREEGNSWFMASSAAGDPAVRRVTMTLPAINSAAQAIFLVSGKEKGRALRDVLSGDPRLPASRVSPVRGKVTYLADAAAAALALPKDGGKR
jgi:6-phosphogluconolactonase